MNTDEVPTNPGVLGRFRAVQDALGGWNKIPLTLSVSICGQGVPS
jgi:hypothetical protein